MNNYNLYVHKNLPQMYQLNVDKDNTLYIEVSGNSSGIPIIFFHGGPGGQSRSEHHSLFKPELFKSIIYDQRGTGKSTPIRSLKNNNSESLIEDVEKIRKFLNVDKLFLVGGSWGATLALLYAQTHPKNVKGIVLRSVFLGTKEETDWAFMKGPQIFAPDLYKSFISYLNDIEKKDVINSYIKKIHDEKSILHSWIWHDYERILSQLDPQKYFFESEKEILKRNGVPNSPFMETHFIKNDFFLKKNQILKNMKLIKDIPGIIIQGRYDLICPPKSAFSISENWNKSKIKILNTAGHSSSDNGIIENLIQSIEEIKDY